MTGTPRLRQHLSAFSLFCCVVLAPFHLSANIENLQQIAIPPATHLIPNADVYPQNFDIAQDNQGYLYVANAEGLLIYSGEKWQHLPLPNGKLVRSLAPGQGRRMYVGGYDDFGYTEPDATGNIVYHSLAQPFLQNKDADFADIWDLLVVDDAVYFRALNRLFRYDSRSGDIKVWQHEGRFGAILADQGEVYLQFRGQGLKRYQDGDFVPFLLSPELHLQLFELVRINDNHWLANRRDGVWLEIKQDEVKRIELPDLPAGNSFFDMRSIEPGVIAMVGKEGVVYLLEWSSGKVSRFALGADVLLAVSKAPQGGIFALSNHRVTHLAWPSPMQFLNEKHGLRGTVYDIEYWQSQWYVLGGAGAFILPKNQQMQVFSKLNWTNHEAWDLLPLTNTKALLADSYSLYLLDKQQQRAISHNALYPRKLIRSAFAEHRVLIGTEFGLAVWADDQTGSGAVILEWKELGTLVSSIVEKSAGEIWLGTVSRGVVRLQLDAEYRNILAIDYFDAAHGLDYGSSGEANLAQIDGDIIVSTATGLYVFNGAAFEPWQSQLNTLRLPGQILTLAQNQAKQTLAYSYNRLYYQSDSGWQQVNTAEIGRVPLQSHWAGHQHWVLGSGSALIFLQPKAAQPNVSRPGILLNTVLSGTADNLVRAQLKSQQPLSVTTDAQVVFKFALPGLYTADTILYRAKLSGLEDEFSEWNRSSQISYYQLEPGQYQFEAQARDPAGNISSIAPFALTVPYPWHATWQAKILWLLLAFGILWLLMRFLVKARTRALSKDRLRLQQMVAEQTRDLATANKRLESLANMDGLTSVANRRRLDTYLQMTAENCREQGRPLSILLIDVDFFKQFNDRHGHSKGDEVLKEIAKVLSASLRRSEDLLARYGGEEFSAVLPGADEAAALEVAEQMRHQVEKHPLGVTVSIGMAWTSGMQPIDLQLLLNQADQALYQAKHAGRNRVVQFVTQGSSS
jgi:diguanylate cyclase (GGDEF)-like protein